MRMEIVTPDNVDAAVRLRIEPEQERFVAPVVTSLAEAYASYGTAWPRLVYDGDELVGFVMAAFDPDCEIDFFRCGVWRLNIAAGHQRKGYGTFAVNAVVDEARRRGQRRVTVLWVPGDGGPEAFYRAFGFTPTGETFHGQVVGEFLS